ncbi:MAG TPA: radical SAM protein [Planctomycetota bacterium]|nr:radical SAM protein [Planctomycetota bacterium]HRU52645.1 radical SAM protein [Planctomycetota bacterium]
MQKLLIIGGTMDPRKQEVTQEDKIMQRYLAQFPESYKLHTSDGYYPFKKKPSYHHRISHTTIIGLAELILAQEAESISMSYDITTIDKLITPRWTNKNPQQLEPYQHIAICTTYIPAPVLRYILNILLIPDHATVYLGGPGSFNLQDEDLIHMPFHYLLKAEGEGRFRQLLLHATNHDIDLTQIPNLTWKQGNTIHHSKVLNQPLNMNDLPCPDWTAIAPQRDGQALYESMRGCPFRCAFCDYPFLMGNQTFRYKTADKIYKDWTELCEKMNVTDILCLDSTFTYPPERLKKLCQKLIDSQLCQKIRWGCYARADNLAKPEIAELLSRANCQYVYVGFETGSDAMLQHMNKGYTVQDNIQAIINCNKYNIMTLGLFLIGFPGETQTTFEETRQFLREHAPTIISVVPWMPDFQKHTKVPIMQPDKLQKYNIQLENPSKKLVTLWKYNTSRSITKEAWGFYWSHQGMDLQGAWDAISYLLQDIEQGKIKSLCEEYFLPHLLDDPLQLYRHFGSLKTYSFYHSFSQQVFQNAQNFSEWYSQYGLQA